MSRLGKKPIIIPEKVEVRMENGRFFVKGPLGEIDKLFKDNIEISIKDDSISLSPKKENKETLSLWGTYFSHISNMIEGVTKGFEKKLVIEGVGFKAQLEGNNLVLHLGLSHPIKMEIPGGVKVEVERNNLTISGVNKETVGQFSANIRMLKKPEPYKGKGIRYGDEVVRRKAGKKAATA